MRVLLFLLLVQPLAAGNVILCGAGGNSEYSQRFANWGIRLQKVLLELGHPQDQLILLREEGAEGQRSDLASIRKVFQNLARTHSAKEDLFIYLIGHGSALRNETKFQIPGPDLSAEALKALLETVPHRKLVLIHSGSAGAGFINVLSGPNRIICTATKSSRESNATEFAEYFIRSLEDRSADRNRDERISLWEACLQAAVLTQAYYVAEGLIATEHALLDDNADALGSRLDGQETRQKPADGNQARTIFIKDFHFGPQVPKQLVKRYLAQINQVENLTRQKEKLPTPEYRERLEVALLAAARTHREIRKLEGRLDQ